MKVYNNSEFLNQLKDDIINKRQSVFLTGSAGVGKTTLLQTLKEELDRVGMNTVLTSTTGLSAFNLGGVTIHKFMGINIQKDVSYLKYFRYSFQFIALKKRLAKFSVIIIDEISMLRADQFNLIDQTLKLACGSNLPFGGKIMVFAGDFYQIPPVVLQTEIQKNQWIFTSEPWLNSNIKVYKLVHVHRQNDLDFINSLDEIKRGITNTKNVKKLLAQCQKRIPNENDTVFFATNEECDEFNQKKLDELPGEAVTYVAKITGKKKEYNKEAIKRECIAKESLTLKVGTKVIIIFNDPSNRFVNGTKATVSKLEEHRIFVKIDGVQKQIPLRRHTWTKVNYYGKKLATFSQIPVIPAYGLTIHKSQGMTLDSIVIDCKNIFTYGQLYVAMSRVRAAKNMTLINFDSSKAITSHAVKNYYQKTKMIEVYVD